MRFLFTFYISICAVLVTGQNLSKAQIAIDEKDYLTALSLYTSCYESDTTNIHCLYQSALAASKSGDNTTAKNLFLRLEKKDTVLQQTWINLGALYEEEENPPKAIKYYTRLHNDNPTNATYTRKLGRLYRSANNRIDAWKYYAMAYKTNPRDIKTAKGLAELAMANSQAELADSIIIAALKIDSTHIGLNLLRAKMMYKNKSYEETANILESVLSRYDFNTYYHKLYGYALVQIDSTDKAIFHLTRALESTPEDEKLHYYLARAYEDIGDNKTAIFHFEKATDFSISPSLDKYFKNLARLYDEQKDLPKAIEAYKESYRYGQDPKILYYLARASDIYYKDKSIAIKYYSRYIKSKDDTKSYKAYAKQRKQYLKEVKHQSK